MLRMHFTPYLGGSQMMVEPVYGIPNGFLRCVICFSYNYVFSNLMALSLGVLVVIVVQSTVLKNFIQIFSDVNARRWRSAVLLKPMYFGGNISIYLPIYILSEDALYKHYVSKVGFSSARNDNYPRLLLLKQFHPKKNIKWKIFYGNSLFSSHL